MGKEGPRPADVLDVLDVVDVLEVVGDELEDMPQAATSVAMQASAMPVLTRRAVK